MPTDVNGFFSFSLAVFLVLLIPGWGLLAWLTGDYPLHATRRRDFLSSLADGAALSIALTALAALLFSLINVRLSGPAVAVLYALVLLLLLGAVVRRGVGLPQAPLAKRAGYFILGLALLIGIITWRFYQARDLALPAWVDSVHHALIAQLIFDYGGLPPDYAPYEVVGFHYHYGFHLLAALFSFWARVSVADSMLWFGQVLNAVVSLSVYRLTYTLAVDFDPDQGSVSSTRWAPFALAFTAALLSGFVFQMPAYYVTWGRYTLLTGLILLGPAMAAAWEVRREPAHTGPGLRLALLLAGISLTHYFVLLVAGLFLFILGVIDLQKAIRRRQPWRDLFILVGWAFFGIFLALPWILPVVLAYPARVGADLVNPIQQSEAARESTREFLRYIILLLGPRHNHLLLGMAGIGLLFSLRRPALHPLAVWAFLLSLLSLPWGLRLNQFRQYYFAIILFFPAAILLADLLMSGAAAVGRLWSDPARRGWLQAAVMTLVLSLFLAWGLRETRNVINATTILTGQADVAALEWVQRSTPADARFFINSTPWIGDVYRGVDGGYWLAPYTGRSSLAPPAIYDLAGPERVRQVKELAERSGKLNGCGPDFWSLVRDAGLTHVYLRAGAGSLQPAGLIDCPRLDLVYEQGGVYIYEIMRPE